MKKQNKKNHQNWLLTKSHTVTELDTVTQSFLHRNLDVKSSLKLGIVTNFQVQKAVYESIKTSRYSAL